MDGAIDLSFLRQYFTGPSLGPFAPLFNSWITVIVSIVWLGCFLYVAVHLLIAVAKLARARQQHRGYGVEDAVADMILPVVALVLLSSIVVLLMLI
jgi:hypothetical protein